jgi:nitrogen fixation NifU-like protein
MPDLKALYQEIILDHNKNPRNFKKLENADCSVEGYNPLCGDHYTIFLKLDGDTITEISFQGSGCAISKASASVMSSVLKGKTRAEAEVWFEKFHHLV